jgi:hypothetical protein
VIRPDGPARREVRIFLAVLLAISLAVLVLALSVASGELLMMVVGR